MDGEDVVDMCLWAFIFVMFLICLLAFLMSGCMFILDLVRFLRHRYSTSPSSALVDRLLETIPDVPYVVDGGSSSPSSSSSSSLSSPSCVICMAAYEAGERCSVLPGCAHVFHRECMSTWLRKHKTKTCPLCRADVTQQASLANAVENMV